MCVLRGCIWSKGILLREDVLVIKVYGVRGGRVGWLSVGGEFGFWELELLL